MSLFLGLYFNKPVLQSVLCMQLFSHKYHHSSLFFLNYFLGPFVNLSKGKEKNKLINA